MQFLRRLKLLQWWVAATLWASISCVSESSKYVGRWECSAGGIGSFDIKSNGDAYLVTDEWGVIYPASLDDTGTLVLSGVPLIGSLPLPIDTDSNELTCSACTCHRYAKTSSTPSGRKEPSQGMPASLVRFFADQPNVEVVEYDADNGTVTVRDKTTGETTMLNVKDIDLGRAITD